MNIPTDKAMKIDFLVSNKPRLIFFTIIKDYVYNVFVRLHKIITTKLFSRKRAKRNDKSRFGMRFMPSSSNIALQ
jgi:hypothetical protein